MQTKALTTAIVFFSVLALTFGSGLLAADVLVGANVAAARQTPLEEIDHSVWDGLLKKYVDDKGMVNYKAWKASSRDTQALDQYLAHLSQANGKLIEPLASGTADFVLGSRLLGEREKGAMPLQSIWGNRLACFLIKCIWGASYTDLGPFRALRLDTLNQLNMKDTNFGWTVEMQVKASQLGLRVLEIPVPYRRRIGQSKISGTVSGTIRAGYKILFTIAKYAMLRKNSRNV